MWWELWCVCVYGRHAGKRTLTISAQPEQEEPSAKRAKVDSAALMTGGMEEGLATNGLGTPSGGNKKTPKKKKNKSGPAAEHQNPRLVACVESL